MKPCGLCGNLHSIQKICGHQDLVKRVIKLSEANSMIPHLMAMNKEAVITAQHYQHLLKKADEAHVLLMGILDKYVDGEKIATEYLEALDSWAKKHLDPATQEGAGEQLELLTEQEMPTNGSISARAGNVSPLVTS